MIIRDRLQNFGSLVSFLCVGCPTGVVATGYGVANTILSTITMGKCKSINFGARYTEYAGCILPGLYERLVRVINPNAKFKGNSDKHIVTYGLLTERAALPIFNQANRFSQSKCSFLKKHVFSRLAYGVYPIVAAVTRTADFALGLLSTVISLLALGTSPKVNGIALRELTFFSLVDDVCKGIRGFINPQQLRNLQQEGVSGNALHYYHDHYPDHYKYYANSFQKSQKMSDVDLIGHDYKEMEADGEFLMDDVSKLYFWSLLKGRLGAQLSNLLDRVDEANSPLRKFVMNYLEPKEKRGISLCLIGPNFDLEELKKSYYFKKFAPHFNQPYYYMSFDETGEPMVRSFTLNIAT